MIAKIALLYIFGTSPTLMYCTCKGIKYTCVKSYKLVNGVLEKSRCKKQIQSSSTAKKC